MLIFRLNLISKYYLDKQAKRSFLTKRRTTTLYNYSMFSSRRCKVRIYFHMILDSIKFIKFLFFLLYTVSRLPNGFGTRADICELLKESQFINELVPDEKVLE